MRRFSPADGTPDAVPARLIWFTISSLLPGLASRQLGVIFILLVVARGDSRVVCKDGAHVVVARDRELHDTRGTTAIGDHE